MVNIFLSLKEKNFKNYEKWFNKIKKRGEKTIILLYIKWLKMNL